MRQSPIATNSRFRLRCRVGGRLSSAKRPSRARKSSPRTSSAILIGGSGASRREKSHPELSRVHKVIRGADFARAICFCSSGRPDGRARCRAIVEREKARLRRAGFRPQKNGGRVLVWFLKRADGEGEGPKGIVSILFVGLDYSPSDPRV